MTDRQTDKVHVEITRKGLAHTCPKLLCACTALDLVHVHMVTNTKSAAGCLCFRAVLLFVDWLDLQGKATMAVTPLLHGTEVGNGGGQLERFGTRQW